MLHSLLTTHAPAGLTIHFLCGPRLPADVAPRLRALVEGLGARIAFHEVADARVAGLQKRGAVAGVMWYRLFLPELLPELDRILYLDADTLVADTLRPLWDTPLGDAYAAAVCNDFEPRLRERPRALGLAHASDYFNSGVLLMNLAQMRRDDIAAQVIATARARGDALMWQDQDPLNIVCAGRWLRLHPRYNCQASLFYFDYGFDLFGEQAVREARARPAIVHFEGPDLLKPWSYLSKHPWRRAYLSHRMQTPWPDVAFADRTPANLLLRLLPVRMILAVKGLSYRVERRLRRWALALQPGAGA